MNLPSWNLKTFYGLSEEITTKTVLRTDVFELDVQETQDSCLRFQKLYQGNLLLHQMHLDKVLSELESCELKIDKISSYAFLLYAKYSLYPNVLSFYQYCQDVIFQAKSKLIFFEIELAALSNLENYIPTTKQYSFWWKSFLTRKKHLLTESEERVVHLKNLTGRESWIRLFDEIMASISFNGKTASTILHQLEHPLEKVRRCAAKEFSYGLNTHARIFTSIFNTLMQDKLFEDEMRGYHSFEESRHMQNCITEDVVNLMSETVSLFYPKLSHRYYSLKAKLLGKNRLDYWDRLAPIGNDHDNKKILFFEAQDIVLSAIESFSPKFMHIARSFFDGYIDAVPRNGKDGGAFCHSCVPTLHPFILLNYHGNLSDVMTLAHELGHGVHQVLSAPRGFYGSDIPLIIAETASLFFEMIVFQYMLASSDKEKRICLLSAKIEDMLNTVVRQNSFFLFEKRAYAARKKGVLSTEELNAIWMSVSQDSLGDAFILHEEYKIYWTHISHFIHTPFYVYAYIFGDCVVNVLYQLYQEGMSNFLEKYEIFLSHGNTQDYETLLSAFNLNPKTQEFWEKGLLSIEKLINILEMELG